MTPMQRAANASAWTMMFPALLGAAVFIVVPFLLAIVLSFTDQKMVQNINIPTEFVGLRNYIRLFTKPDFLNAFWNTFCFAVFIVPIQSGIALAAAMLINSSLPARNAFRSIFFLPTVITMVVVSVIWFILFSGTGFFNQVVRVVTFGWIEQVDWLRNRNTALPSIIMLSAWQGFGFQMVIYLAGLQGINRELYEAADVDGATPWQKFMHVTMPGLRNTHVFVLVTTTIAAFKLFTQVNLLTQGGPNGATQTVVRQIYETGFKIGNIGGGAAISVAFFMIVLLISQAQRIFLTTEEEVKE
jgi:multiple sugar transport system permease protein